MRVSIVVAAAENGVIGRDGDLPWRLPADLAHFKRTTTSHAIIMGRKTWDSIGRPLSDRQNIVLTRDPEFTAERVDVVHSLEQAMARVRRKEAFVIGGEAIFTVALAVAERVFLTLVHAQVEGDVYFPLKALADWRLVSDEFRVADDRNEFAMSFREYARP